MTSLERVKEFNELIAEKLLCHSPAEHNFIAVELNNHLYILETKILERNNL